ncbi:hypothetical protein [Klebsiella michiganensis]|uniref:hypothetical protein n=1 Tax=Klebsiella michiganensis TaxID=1134687 RepID=UPI0021DAD680|nr:hypothetical protein [Klebsiella michiganensis]MDM4122672.1 hypothetical protein [Klebsiella michiganensis]MDM4159695.1 hypothetical protein [Klebsiella michiganensis]UYB55559.1 hypothetical protein N6B35_19950 [Klebsiella michiganensis]HDX9140735.1 hypothetical protein [Klebsiella michiganensis]
MIIFYLCCGVLVFLAAYILDVIKTENHIDRFLAVIVIVLLWPLIVLAVVKYIAKIIL